MRHIKTKISSNMINIFIGSNLENLIVKTLFKTIDRNQFIISKTVYPYVKELVNRLSKKPPIIIDSKEENKSLKSFEKLLKQCYERSLNRQSRIIGIGGGMVGDYIGFLAASYMRGVEFIYVPTTLISQCDSVINKVALNVNYVKNLIGSFYSPTIIFCDINYIKSLPQSAISCGMSEIIKYALIKSKKLLKMLKSYSKKNIQRKDYNWEEIVYESLKTKLSLIRKDPYDSNGIQKGLNYGHTFAHALEDYTNYKYPHGYAVGIGLKFSGYISNELKILNEKNLNMQNDLLELCKLDLVIDTDFNIGAFIRLLKRHTHSENKVNLILLSRPGKYFIQSNVQEKTIRKIITKYLLK